jgi:hypothetical protein
MAGTSKDTIDRLDDVVAQMFFHIDSLLFTFVFFQKAIKAKDVS